VITAGQRAQAGPDPSGVSGATASGRAKLSQIDPDLFADGDGKLGELTVNVRRLAMGAWDDIVDGGLGILVVRGLLAQGIRLGGNRSLILAWEGDLIGAPSAPPSWLEHPLRWHVLEQAIVADLDEEFLAAASEFPAFVPALAERVSRTQARAAMAVAVAHLSRVEHRILAALLLLAEDRGRATVDGLVLRMALTHERLGEIVGARRPTVSLALRQLDALGLVRRGADASWVIHPDGFSYLHSAEGAATGGNNRLQESPAT
jgi:CRP/FNR family cyclic AMP-dependent transcriptional regulator